MKQLRTFEAGVEIAGDIAAAGKEKGLSDVDVERSQQARGIVETAEATQLVSHDISQWVTARRRWVGRY